MSSTHTLDIDVLMSQAARYFDRPSFSMPTFVSNAELAILDDRSGVPQLSLLDSRSLRVTPVTSTGERLLTLHGSSGGRIVFGMDAGGNERQQVWLLPDMSSEPRIVTNRPDAIHEPGVIAHDGRSVLVKSNARDESTFDIVHIDLDSGSIEHWMDNAGTAAPVAMSRDGRRALVIRANTNLDADVLLIDRSGNTNTNLTAHIGEAWMLDAAFGPHEDSVWFLNNEGREFTRLERIDLATGARKVVIEDAWDIEAFKVSPTGSHVIVSVNENGWSRVAIHDLENPGNPKSIEGLGRGTVDRFDWSPDGKSVAFGHSTSEVPSRIVIAGIDGTFRIASGEREEDRPRTVTPELVHFSSFDGLEIPGFLFRPEGEGPFPVLVEVHGGPESQRRLQYASAVPTDQFVCSLGIAVLSLNVRGSTGYGKSYSHLDDRELRLDSVRDVAAAVDWLRQRDDVIPERIGVMGQSYGGFMTLASIAFYPTLWAAAVDVVGIANFVSFLERTGPWRRKHRSEEYGFLETDRELLERISPLNHVDKIETPLFVIHGRNDPRVPLFEAEQIVAALQSRDREVELMVFDNEGHGLSKRDNRIAGYAAAAEFLASHLLA